MQSFFQRAIIQSSPMTVPFRTYLEYVTPAVRLVEQLHCATGDVENAFKILKKYPPVGFGGQRSLVARAATQWVFACSTRIFARKGATYSYVFGYPFDTEDLRNRIQCSGHACHADGIPFLFESS
ncbi:unnamed protein product [Rotaria magnacalcarata]|uniref:Uncharacterized protein n=1 Tax=Rotaria magnacalcarata TaxID=392030 RepID=A0A8S2RHM8_9BILA|nr:unnamed protein product [Rotaria magnacalcarata]CAF4161463.1 unnamed protein product [Rotaria magnacalcarata]CAF4244204.1 unnamed protein product [Rotaria magnacalcarata]